MCGNIYCAAHSQINAPSINIHINIPKLVINHVCVQDTTIEMQPFEWASKMLDTKELQQVYFAGVSLSINISKTETSAIHLIY